MSDYCTFFDRGYLPQGLALWNSLRRHEPEARLWVLALDEDTGVILGALGTPGLNVVPLAELLAADIPLAASQAGRAPAEFVFTLKPRRGRARLPRCRPVFLRRPREHPARAGRAQCVAGAAPLSCLA